MQLARFLAKTASSAGTLDKIISFVQSAKTPSPIHKGFRGFPQAKLSKQ